MNPEPYRADELIAAAKAMRVVFINNTLNGFLNDLPRLLENLRRGVNIAEGREPELDS